MTYYADVAGGYFGAWYRRYMRADTPSGLVPEAGDRVDTSGEEFDDELGNGDLPPQWGIDFVVFSGTMTYGPWADRQR